jgi:hypothetical protein
VLVVRKPTSSLLGRKFYKCDVKHGGCGHFQIDPDMSQVLAQPPPYDDDEPPPSYEEATTGPA